MNSKELNVEMLDFIQRGASVFHTTKTIKEYLDESGFEYLPEGVKWKLKKGKKYYTIRNESSIIAFKVGSKLDDYHFQLTASHSDSPSFKIKTSAELSGPKEYLRLDVEGYGGMLNYTWLDRPLSIAGRVLIKKGTEIESRLIDFDANLLLIPSVAIHFSRAMNDGVKFNNQIDLCPLFSAGQLKAGDFDKMIANKLGIESQDILAKDLFVVNHEKPVIWGIEEEFVSSPKLDDLQCAFVSLKSFLQSNNQHDISVYCCFDNEEVGSNTKQGALSTFLSSTLRRINGSLGYTDEDYYQAIAKSFLVSCDNAHAVHPNHPELTDVVNCAMMNKGLVIKENANQKYTTDAISRAIFVSICQKAKVEYQLFANRSDLSGGSTLGNLSNTQVSLHAVDIGLPQLAMHSCYETAGVEDSLTAMKALETFYNTNIQINESSKVNFD